MSRRWFATMPDFYPTKAQQCQQVLSLQAPAHRCCFAFSCLCPLSFLYWPKGPRGLVGCCGVSGSGYAQSLPGGAQTSTKAACFGLWCLENKGKQIVTMIGSIC